MENKRPKTIYLISIAALLLAAVFSTGFHHFDEHFQILEFAGLKLQLTTAAQLPWEYAAQIRPALQPAMVVCVYKLLGGGLGNPFLTTLLLRLLSTALSFYAMWRMYRLYRPQISDPVLGKWFLWLSFLLWFYVYDGVRFSSENWSGACFVIAFALYFSKNRQKIGFYEGIGALLGLSFVFRFQTGLMISGLLAWMFFVEKTGWDKLLRIVAGMMLTAGIGILADRWFYGEWTFTAWHYFDQNILQGKAASFGVKPWYWYFSETFVQAIPPFSLLFIGSMLLVLRYQPKNALSWTILPFLLIHCLIGHKELRFLFPLIGFCRYF